MAKKKIKPYIKNMNKKIIIGILVVLIAFGALFWFMARESKLLNGISAPNDGFCSAVLLDLCYGKKVKITGIFENITKGGCSGGISVEGGMSVSLPEFDNDCENNKQYQGKKVELIGIIEKNSCPEGSQCWGRAVIKKVDSIKIIGGDTANGSTGMANPASVYCGQQGGKSVIVEDAGGQKGMCVMPDGIECDEWEFFRTKACAATSTVPVGNNDVCGRENCHGLDINCGANVAEVCTMEYQLGDKCLRLVNCGIKDGVCQQITNAAFDACKTCVQKCVADFANDQIKMFDCESKCE